MRLRCVHLTPFAPNLLCVKFPSFQKCSRSTNSRPCPALTQFCAPALTWDHLWMLFPGIPRRGHPACVARPGLVQFRTRKFVKCWSDSSGVLLGPDLCPSGAVLQRLQRGLRSSWPWPSWAPSRVVGVCVIWSMPRGRLDESSGWAKLDGIN